MSEQNSFLEEQLSAILDGEASELEVRRFLQQLDELEPGQRKNIYARWERYQRISVGLGNEPAGSLATAGFAESVSLQVASEPAPQAGVNKALQASEKEELNSYDGAGKARPAFGMRLAVAASIGLAVIVGFQQFQINNQTEALRLANNNPQVQQLQSSDALPDEFGSQAVLATTVASVTPQIDEEPVDAAEAQRRLQEYLLDHANHASQQRSQGIVPFARVASFETE